MHLAVSSPEMKLSIILGEELVLRQLLCWVLTAPFCVHLLNSLKVKLSIMLGKCHVLPQLLRCD